MAAKTDHVAWLMALTRAALPGTERVSISYATPAPNETRYTLTCFDETGRKIGDARDHDLLKSIMSPLEKLCNCEDAPLTVELNLSENTLSFENHI